MVSLCPYTPSLLVELALGSKPPTVSLSCPFQLPLHYFTLRFVGQASAVLRCPLGFAVIFPTPKPLLLSGLALVFLLLLTSNSLRLHLLLEVEDSTKALCSGRALPSLFQMVERLAQTPRPRRPQSGTCKQVRQQASFLGQWTSLQHPQ